MSTSTVCIIRISAGVIMYINYFVVLLNWYKSDYGDHACYADTEWGLLWEIGHSVCLTISDNKTFNLFGLRYNNYIPINHIQATKWLSLWVCMWVNTIERNLLKLLDVLIMFAKAINYVGVQLHPRIFVSSRGRINSRDYGYPPLHWWAFQTQPIC